jgi:hypothetical protein
MRIRIVELSPEKASFKKEEPSIAIRKFTGKKHLSQCLHYLRPDQGTHQDWSVAELIHISKYEIGNRHNGNVDIRHRALIAAHQTSAKLTLKNERRSVL